MNTTRIHHPVELSQAECWALLREALVGRLAVTTDRGPDIFPVNHVVDHGTLVFKTAPGTKLMAAVGQRVAYEIDGYDPATALAWSVVAKGPADEVRGLYDVIEAMDLPIFPWHAEPKAHLVRITPDDVTGRRFEARPDVIAQSS